MKNILLLTFTVCYFSITLFAQTKSDKVFAQEGVKEVNVKEVTELAIKYTYPGEETLYTLNKMLVSKIQFASGREEVFQTAPKFINKLEDSKEVYIATNPDEVVELENIGVLNTYITNVGPLISINRSSNKQIAKLKLEAAMRGANVVLIENVQQGIRTNYSDSNYVANSTYTKNLGSAYSTITQYYNGIAYRTNPFDISELKNKIAFAEYHLMTVKNLNQWKNEVQTFEASKYTKEGRPVFNYLKDISEEGNQLFVSAEGISEEFDKLEVIDAGEDFVVLAGINPQKTSNFYLFTKSYIPPLINIKVAD